MYRSTATSGLYTVRQGGTGNDMKTTLHSVNSGEELTIEGEWELAEWAALLGGLVQNYAPGIGVEDIDGP